LFEAGTFDDLFVGHATWDTFTNAWPRIFKHVSLSVLTADGEWTPHTASFSSSPGFLASIDDFYSIEGAPRSVLAPLQAYRVFLKFFSMLCRKIIH
jgi:hypothetical protein